MRSIRTFVLHLYTDPNVPDRLCGDLHPVEESDVWSFKNPTELEELLRQFIYKTFSVQIPAANQPIIPNKGNNTPEKGLQDKKNDYET